MLGFSLISAGAFMWFVSDSWQAHFQVAYNLLQPESFCHIENDGTSPWPRQWQHMPFGVAGDFYLKVYWVAFLEKYYTKTFQACICLQRDYLGS